jgi:hypothetical protein
MGLSELSTQIRLYHLSTMCYQMPNTQARILPTQDFLVVVRHAGVYSPRCLKPLLSETQATLMGIPTEAA